LLRAYGLFDILEIEGFGPNGISSLYYGDVDPRLASSAANIYGKKLVSCESFTWLGEHFSVSLEDLKHEADQIILHGINQLVYHGYPYSPPAAGRPGWVFYASTLINHNNTWWPFVDNLNRYVARNSFLARLGRAVKLIAVYLPIHDKWYGKNDILKDLRISLRKNGFLSNFDYINDDRLINATSLHEGYLRIHDVRYQALVIPDVEYMPVKVATAIANLVGLGLKLIIVGDYPSRDPGFNPIRYKRVNEVSKIFEELISGAKSGAYNVYNVRSISELDKLFDEAGIIRDFIVEPSNNRSAIQYLHRRTDGVDLYFIVNNSRRMANVFIKISVPDTRQLEVWSPVDGSRYVLPFKKLNGARIGFDLSLDSLESCWVVALRGSGTGPDKNVEKLKIYKNVNELRVNGPWRVTFEVPQNIFPKQDGHYIELKTDELFDWSKHDDVCHFSGTATYNCQFVLKSDDLMGVDRLVLDLGVVKEVAEVLLNSNHVGITWFGHKILDITNFVQVGMNLLEIKVTNLLLNEVIGYAKKRIKWYPDYFFVNKNYKRFDPSEMDLLKSGLLGPVRVIFQKRIQ
ncbi:MAG: glycosyl hydrolase, partial [Promethearchaeota archaeon]